MTHGIMDVTFNDLDTMNRIRQAEWPGDAGQVSASYRGLELGGEVGECQNVVKKLERERMGIKGSRATLEDLKKEIGDVVICAALLAGKYGLSTEECVRLAFNKTSEQIGLTSRL